MIHLRQIALVARNLANAQADLEAVFGIEPCHVDPEVAEFGLENVLLPIRTNFIEIVAPTQDGTGCDRQCQIMEEGSQGSTRKKGSLHDELRRE